LEQGCEGSLGQVPPPEHTISVLSRAVKNAEMTVPMFTIDEQVPPKTIKESLMLSIMMKNAQIAKTREAPSILRLL